MRSFMTPKGAVSRQFVRHLLSWLWLGCVSVGLTLAGCNGPGGDYKPAAEIPKAPDDHGHDHGHGAEGPHHGVLVELGPNHELHGEIVLNAKTHTLTVYLLGPDAKSPAPSSATEITISQEGGSPLVLKPAAGQPEGKHAVFELTDEKAIHELADVGFIHGKISMMADGKSIEAGLDVHFDGDHAHEHEPATAAPATTTPESATPAAEPTTPAAEPTTPAEPAATPATESTPAAEPAATAEPATPEPAKPE
jgi:hypothetical protein